MSVLIFLLAWTVLSLPLGILVGKAIAEMDGGVKSLVIRKLGSTAAIVTEAVGMNPSRHRNRDKTHRTGLRI